MTPYKTIIAWVFSIAMITSYAQTSDKIYSDDYVWNTEQFADIMILRYQVSGFEQLSLNQKKLVYFLTQAGYSGRDIIWDQNYKYNLAIRHALDGIVRKYQGDKNNKNWKNFMVYTKRVWFSNGIHHHYSMNKFIPDFTIEYFTELLTSSGNSLSDDAMESMFNPEIDSIKVNLDPEKGLVKGSAVNFYDEGITEQEVIDYYDAVMDRTEIPIATGLNSKLVRNADSSLSEIIYSSDGMYGAAIKRIVFWLEKTIDVAENDAQRNALQMLIEFYLTGDLKMWDEHNIMWIAATEGDIDYINGFIESNNDPMGFKGSYESIVQIKDFEASKRMMIISKNAQWFEDNSPILNENKNLVTVTYDVVNIVGGSGNASPSTPIEVNLPNSNWIKANHGSKSISIRNIAIAYKNGVGKEMLQEFTLTNEEYILYDEYGILADELFNSLREVVGHTPESSNESVATPDETLRINALILEEARADLIALYFIMDPKMKNIGLVESLDVGKTAYNSYIRNAMMLQLRNLEPGVVVEEVNMRNRQMIAAWCYDKGKSDNVIEKKVVDGKTYFIINDYKELRILFGELLSEIQQILSDGDYITGERLIETYGVQVDTKLHAEVLERVGKLSIAPYSGFINPKLVPIYEGSDGFDGIEDENLIIDIKVAYPLDFTGQMLEYGQNYSFLPIDN